MVFGNMFFSYDDERATVITQHQSAIATSSLSGWVKDGSGVDNFFGAIVHGPADCVHTEYYGNFHWEPAGVLSGYYHTLRTGQNGEGGGATYCDNAYGGTIVLRVVKKCSTRVIH